MDNGRKSQRIRHEAARGRTLVVAEKTLLSPNYLSIRFDCGDLGDFVSASPDDHIKLLVSGPAQAGGRPTMRDYTPRAFDARANSFVIDFALHSDPGPATAWAIAAKPGDSIEIGGPRGSVVISPDYSEYWLIGDEAAIPSIMRRFTEWSGARIHALIAVSGPNEEIPLPLGNRHDVRWIHRSANTAADPSQILTALPDWFAPTSDCFVWIAAEAGVTKALRAAILETGHPVTSLKASGYWTWGMADTTATFE